MRFHAARLDPTPKAGGRGPMLAPWRARQIALRLDARISEPVRVKELSALARLTTGHFSKAFRGVFGIPPHAYLIELRLARARELMLRTDHPLAQIAVACGLYDQSHLTRLFRKRHGQSPAAWRRARRAAPAALRHSQPQGPQT